MADQEMTGAQKTVTVDTDALVQKRKNIIKWVVIIVLGVVAVYLVKKYFF